MMIICSIIRTLAHNGNMRFILAPVITLVFAALPLGAQVQEGDVPDYQFRSVPFNSLGINSLDDLRGKPVFVEFWGTR